MVRHVEALRLRTGNQGKGHCKLHPCGYLERLPIAPRQIGVGFSVAREGLGLGIKGEFPTRAVNASFGFVVTSSVGIAGVLLVFCYLIVPSVGAMLYAQRIGRRLAIGWTMGAVVSALGVYLSLKVDLPTGATIVCTFGLVLILMALVRPFISSGSPPPA